LVPQVGKTFSQFHAATTAPAFYGAWWTPQFGGCGLHGISLDVNEEYCIALVFGQFGQGGRDFQHGFAFIHVVTGVLDLNTVLIIVVGQRNRGAYFSPAQPIQTGVNHDSVEPCCDGSVSTVLIRSAECGNQRILN